MHTSNQPIPMDFDNEVYRALEHFDRRINFRWNLRNDILELNTPIPNNFYDIHKPTVPFASSFLWLSNFIHPDDVYAIQVYLHSIFCAMTQHINGTRTHSCKLRLRHRNKQNYIWSEIHIITYFDHYSPVIAFGNIRNIHAQKIWQQRIEREASHDKLTGLLNKDSAKERIAAYLNSLSPEIDAEALLLIDADGFKNINDSFGHLFGDAVLEDMGAAIDHNFRQTDIKGRIGGDEFIVLFRDMTNIESLKERCQQLIQSLNRNYRSGDTVLPFSISIGLAHYPDHGTTYTDLFKHADRALYEAKSKGKNQFVIYQSSLFGNASITNHRSPDDFIALQQKAFKDNMIEFIFKLLYETNSPEATISLTLGMLGQRFNLDRVAIDRFDNDGTKYENAYEWLSPCGISLRNENHPTSIKQQISAHYDIVLSQYKPTPYGVMSLCEDTRKLPVQYQDDLKSIKMAFFAHCLISHGSETLGCIGFESTRPMTHISAEIINSLSVFSVILGNILLPHDTNNHLKLQKERLYKILDHMQEAVYVVDKDSLQPIYYNSSIRQALSQAANHRTCYQLFHNRKVPCENCPVSKLSPSGSEYIQTAICNWTEKPTPIRVCNIDWDNDSNRHYALVIQEPVS